MDWLTVSLSVIVGAAIGFGITRLFMLSNAESEKIKQQAKEAESELAQYRKLVSEHMRQSNALTEELADMNHRIIAHMEQSAEILESKAITNDLPFFSRETTEALQASLPELQPIKRKPKRSNDGTQPRDYSDSPSGLLAAQSQNVTHAEKV